MSNAFTLAYIACLYFTSTNGEDHPRSDAELAPETRDTIELDCAQFQAAAAHLLNEAYERVGYDESRAGHDFWLTRNGHGAGFWCRDELEGSDLGERLTTMARMFGEQDLYNGDDGLLYLS